MFPVVGYHVFTDLRRDFDPLLFADPLQILKFCRLSLGNSNLKLPPQILYKIKVWRLTRPLHYFNVLLLDPFLCCLTYMLWVIVLLEHPSTTNLPVPLAEKQPQSILFPPPCLMVGMVFLGSKSAFFPPNTAS